MTTIYIAKPYQKVFREEEQRKCGCWKKVYRRKRSPFFTCDQRKPGKMAVSARSGHV